MNTYSMENTLKVANQASKDIESFLRQNDKTITVINVEYDTDYQKKDIDLLWVFKHKGSELIKRIEIKGDRYSKTGNYFIETMSNKERQNIGCFLYTESDFIFYYFIDSRELNIMPMPQTKEWFLKNMNRFQEKTLSTNVGKNKSYTTSGLLVPKKILNSEVKGVRVFNIFC